jgi:hypothetical protein
MLCYEPSAFGCIYQTIFPFDPQGPDNVPTIAFRMNMDVDDWWIDDNIQSSTSNYLYRVGPPSYKLVYKPL